MNRVLIVEDSYIVRRGIAETTDWRSVDCELAGEASDGEQGLQMIRSLDPDIIITDIRLPGMSGIDMIEKAKPQAHGKFIIVSAYSEFEYAKRALQLDVVDYLVKPIREEQLMDALRKAGAELLAGNISKKKSSTDMVQQTIDYICTHYAQVLTVKSIADHISISESRLSHLFREKTGVTVIDFITRTRIEKACDLLKDPDQRISDVAYAVGFNDQHYFSNVFRRITGKTPREYRGS